MTKKFTALIQNHGQFFKHGDVDLKQLMIDHAKVSERLSYFRSQNMSEETLAKVAGDDVKKLARIEEQLEAVATLLHDIAPHVMQTPSASAAAMNEIMNKGLCLNVLHHIASLEMTLGAQKAHAEGERRQAEFLELQRAAVEQQGRIATTVSAQHTLPAEKKKASSGN